MIQRLITTALIGLGLVDVLTTFYGISNGYVEENLILRSLTWNPLLMMAVMLLMKAVAIGVSYVLLRKSLLFPALVLIALFALADLSNLSLLF